MSRFLTGTVRFIRYLLASFFMQVAAAVGFIAAGTVWAWAGSLWAGAGAGALLVVLLVSLPIYGFLEGDRETVGTVVAINRLAGVQFRVAQA